MLVRFCSREQNRTFVPFPVLFPTAKDWPQVLAVDVLAGT